MATSEKASTMDRPLRADAARNRARIVTAARELFAERGLEVTLDDVASHAGVGVGTVYRRFTNRDELIEAVFIDHLAVVGTRMSADTADAGPWEALVILLEGVGRFVTEDRGLAAVLTQVDHSKPALEQAKKSVESLVRDIFARAKDAGVIRAEVAQQDLYALVCMLSAISEATEADAPGTWRRYLELLLDGMRAGEGRVPLTVPALTDAQLERIHDHAHKPKAGRDH